MTIAELLKDIRQQTMARGVWLDLIVGDDGEVVASISSKPDKWGGSQTLMKDEVGNDIEQVLRRVYERVQTELDLPVAA